MYSWARARPELFLGLGYPGIVAKNPGIPRCLVKLVTVLAIPHSPYFNSHSIHSLTINIHLLCIFNNFIALTLRGGHVKPPKFEHIFEAVITFSPFLLCRYFSYQPVACCLCFKMICEMSL